MREYCKVLLLCFCAYNSLFGAAGDELRCIEKEREALLEFKKGLIDDDNFLLSWGSNEDQRECCQWNGIECSHDSGHVIALQLSTCDSDYYIQLKGTKISSALLELKYLSHLDLSCNTFQNVEIPDFIGSMEKLQFLNFHDSNFSGVIHHQFVNLNKLRTLDLGGNDLVFNNLSWISRLSSLSSLDLSYNQLKDHVNSLQDILNLPSLEELYLTDCDLFSMHLSIVSSSASLSVLDLSSTGLASSSFHWLFNISSSFRSIDLSHNLLEANIPSDFGKLAFLEHLDLSWNGLIGGVPKSLGNLSHLQTLNLSGNSLNGAISEVHLSKLHNLKELDLSYNSLAFNVSADWIPPFQLNVLNLATCNTGPRFLTWLRTQTNLSELDLSCNSISEEMPKWMWDFSPKIDYLNLSHNQILGTIPDLSPSSYRILDIRFNNFSGPLPSPPPNSLAFLLNDNKFVGSISSICTSSAWNFDLLDLSNNQFSGELPDCWENNTNLDILNLSNNKFSGEIPHSIGSLLELQMLQLHNNNFSGELPSNLMNCMRLKMLDVGGNNLRGNIPAWIGTHLPDLYILSLGHNNFSGNIPTEICYLTKIQILDLSWNFVSGKIPQCFNNFTSLIRKNTTFDSFIAFVDDVSDVFIDHVFVQWKRQQAEYGKKTVGLVKLIDLSSNRFVGNIPNEFSQLRALISLNLSRNYLSGHIIPNIGEMEMLETLDLSRNNFSGEIPKGLAKLDRLAVLDLSNNNLSGKIPLSTQLQSFEPSTYAANDGLCGLPLTRCPGDHEHNGPNPPTTQHGKQENVDDGFMAQLRSHEFYIPIVMGFIVGFWGIIGTLVLKNSWRYAYFNFFSRMGDWLYVTTMVYTRRLKRNSTNSVPN